MHNNALHNMNSISVHGRSASRMTVEETNAAFDAAKSKQAKGKK